MIDKTGFGNLNIGHAKLLIKRTIAVCLVCAPTSLGAQNFTESVLPAWQTNIAEWHDGYESGVFVLRALPQSFEDLRYSLELQRYIFDVEMGGLRPEKAPTVVELCGNSIFREAEIAAHLDGSSSAADVAINITNLPSEVDSISGRQQLIFMTLQKDEGVLVPFNCNND